MKPNPINLQEVVDLFNRQIDHVKNGTDPNRLTAAQVVINCINYAVDYLNTANYALISIAYDVRAIRENVLSNKEKQE